jgi:hypothetical protein
MRAQSQFGTPVAVEPSLRRLSDLARLAGSDVSWCLPSMRTYHRLRPTQIVSARRDSLDQGRLSGSRPAAASSGLSLEHSVERLWILNCDLVERSHRRTKGDCDIEIESHALQRPKLVSPIASRSQATSVYQEPLRRCIGKHERGNHRQMRARLDALEVSLGEGYRPFARLNFERISSILIGARCHEVGDSDRIPEHMVSSPE